MKTLLLIAVLLLTGCEKKTIEIPFKFPDRQYVGGYLNMSMDYTIGDTIEMPGCQRAYDSIAVLHRIIKNQKPITTLRYLSEVHRLAYMQGVNACIENANARRSFTCGDLVETLKYKKDSVFVLNAFK